MITKGQSLLNGGELPLITAVIPCRNEEKNIGECLESIVDNGYPMDRMEILVVDGMSDDRSREIAARYAQKHRAIRLLDNPKKILAAAWNIGIQNSHGKIIFAMNAHAKAGRGYFGKCVDYLDSSDADCVGPVIETHPQDKSFWGDLIALALAHPFGVGNSHFRTGIREPKWVDTVHMGAYRSQVFQTVGFYNEELIRSQDIDFHNRLRMAGGKILLVPDIRVCYYTRSDIKKFLKYGYTNGYWVSRPCSYGVFIAGIRHTIPMVFVLAILVPLMAAVWVPGLWLLSLFVLALYFVVAAAYSVPQAISNHRVAYAFCLPIVFFAIHFPYGIGCTVGLVQSLLHARFWAKVIKSPIGILQRGHS